MAELLGAGESERALLDSELMRALMAAVAIPRVCGMFVACLIVRPQGPWLSSLPLVQLL